MIKEQILQHGALHTSEGNRSTDTQSNKVEPWAKLEQSFWQGIWPRRDPTILPTEEGPWLDSRPQKWGLGLPKGKRRRDKLEAWD